MTEPDLDQLLSWELAIACLRVELKEGRKLSPKEMIDLVDMAMPQERPACSGFAPSHEDVSRPAVSPAIAEWAS